MSQPATGHVTTVPNVPPITVETNFPFSLGGAHFEMRFWIAGKMPPYKRTRFKNLFIVAIKNLNASILLQKPQYWIARWTQPKTIASPQKEWRSLLSHSAQVRCRSQVAHQTNRPLFRLGFALAYSPRNKRLKLCSVRLHSNHIAVHTTHEIVGWKIMTHTGKRWLHKI